MPRRTRKIARRNVGSHNLNTPQAALITTSTGTVDEQCLRSMGFEMLRPRSKWPVYHFFLSRTEPQRDASTC